MITGVQVGAYEFFSGKQLEAGAGVGTAAVGVGARHQEGREVLSSDGDSGACEQSALGDEAPPQGCGALLRIELAPILEAAAPADAEGEHCPASTHPTEQNKCLPDGPPPATEFPELAAAIAKAEEAARAGNPKEAGAAASDALTAYKAALLPADSPAVDYAAKAQFLIAESVAQLALEVELEGKGDALKSSVEILNAYVSGAAHSYEEVAKYGRLEWTIAATFRKGFLYESVYDKFMSTPTPAKIAADPELDAAYHAALADKAGPWQDTAVDLYEKAIEMAKSDDVETEWAHKAARRLLDLRPNAL